MYLHTYGKSKVCMYVRMYECTEGVCAVPAPQVVPVGECHDTLKHKKDLHGISFRDYPWLTPNSFTSFLLVQ